MNRTWTRLNFSRDYLSQLETALSNEWVVANGLGGYASSTILGVNTRKYHGLLVAAFNPPVDRRVMLSKVDEQLTSNSQVYHFGANEFRHGIFPEGLINLDKFSRFPFPTFEYSVGEFRLRKTVLTPYQQNAALILYEVVSPFSQDATLRISPLVNSRHFHSVTLWDRADWKLEQEASSQKFLIQTANPDSSLVISASQGHYVEDEKKTWVKGLFFRMDHSLGTSHFDDCLVPGHFDVQLSAGTSTAFHLAAAAAKDKMQAEKIHSAVSRNPKSAQGVLRKELERQSELLTCFRSQHQTAARDRMGWLSLAADSFVVDRLSTRTKTVIAGYPWFEDWGRDSLIALPGLTLVLGRFEDARQILLTFRHYCREGIVPNRFPDEAGDQPAYNTVDATLWYFNAVLQYVKYTGDFEFVKRELWGTLQSVVNHHIQGTINNIHMDDDGLITHGPQLTWMDAMTDGRPITPRAGKAVEIQALWFNALRTMELLARRFGEDDLADEYRDTAQRAAANFREKFWNPDRSCLFDVVSGRVQHAAIRPNQIFAVSLDFSMLSRAQQAATVSLVREKLWIPYGLRTLSAEDPAYHGSYSGGWAQRNQSYHNGTAWPWLLGPFTTAFLKGKNHSPESRSYAFETFLQPLLHDQMRMGGVGAISEVFDGDPPHRPGGCIAQAWSVAEPLRAMVEDVWFERPQFEVSVRESSAGEKAK